MNIEDSSSSDEYYIVNCKEYSYDSSDDVDCSTCKDGFYRFVVSGGKNRCDSNPATEL